MDQVSGTTFRCRRCGRLLAAPRRPSPFPDDGDDRTLAVTGAVPEARAPSPAPPSAPSEASAPSPAPPSAPSELPPPPSAAIELPAPLRALVWLVALPLGLVIAALPLRAIGWLSVDDVFDAFAGSGLGRWGILLVLLPLWAGISASLAHLGIENLTRRRASAR